MPTSRYLKPPITEAVIEFRFGSAISSRNLNRFLRNMAREYPITEQTYEVSAQVRIVGNDKEPEVKPEQTLSGYKLTGREEVDLLMLGSDRIGTIRLAPYDGWENFIARAKRNYETLRKVSGSLTLTRMATRYINRLDIPIERGSPINVSDFILVDPRIPRTISRINMFSTHFVGVVPEIEGQVNVTVGTVPSPLIDHGSLLLDIDLFKEQNLPRREEGVWEVLETLRQQKNAIFESFVTDRARELFDRG